MSLTLERPLSVLPSQLSGNVRITVPIKCAGPGGEVAVNLFIYEGSLWVTHGTLIASYTQDVSFLGGEEKDVSFEHTVVSTAESRRDVGVEIVEGDRVLASREFDDAFTVVTTGGGGIMDSMSSMMGMVMMVMMIGSIAPALGGQGNAEGENA
jgi:hypothetical protein